MHFTLSDLVTDITQNGLEAGAGQVELDVTETDTEFRFVVRDDGKGMTAEELKRAVDPFVTDGEKHPNRKIGLGLPFLIQTSEQSGGGCDIKSEKGKGTVITAWFNLKNVDTPPVGGIPTMFRTILMFNSDAEIIIRRKKKNNEYEVCKTDLIDILGSFEDVGSLVLLGDYLKSLESD
ncbi:MAG: sensor histidine kinase [Treponema sp.]|nr:sensor histidine kinase [Treponema sp.]